MKYQEKIRLAEETIEWLSKGRSFEDFRKELIQRKHYQHEIENIFRSAKKLILEDNNKAFGECLLKNDLESARAMYSSLNDEAFDVIKKFKIVELIEDCKRQTDYLAQDEFEEEDIIEQVANHLFPEQDVRDQIYFYKKHNMPLNRQEKQNYRAIGIAIIVTGVALSIASYNFPKAGSFSIYFGVITLGLVIFFKSEVKN